MLMNPGLNLVFRKKCVENFTGVWENHEEYNINTNLQVISSSRLQIQGTLDMPHVHTFWLHSLSL